MSTDIDSLTPAERWAGTPRPLQYTRVRLHRDGQAQYIQSVLEAERDDLYDDLSDLRAEGKAEGSREVEEVKTHLRFLIAAIRDISTGMIELA